MHVGVVLSWVESTIDVPVSYIKVRAQTEQFLGQKIPRSAQNSSVGGLLLCTDGQIQTRHVHLEVYCYLLSDPFSLRPTF